ncbi:unnamed protein product, partial [Polarella glacialis]
MFSCRPECMEIALRQDEDTVVSALGSSRGSSQASTTTSPRCAPLKLPDPAVVSHVAVQHHLDLAKRFQESELARSGLSRELRSLKEALGNSTAAHSRLQAHHGVEVKSRSAAQRER